MTELIPFDYSGQTVRAVPADGEPGFVAADVCAVLDIKDVRQAVERLHPDDRYQTPVVDSAGRMNPKTWVVTESGLYDLIIRSDKPEARPFRRWVTAEVLPSIRSTGGFGSVALPDMGTPEGQLAVAQMLMTGAQKQIEQAARIKTLQPKADYVDGFVDAVSDGTLMRVLANQVGMGEKALRDLLVERKVIYRKLEGSRWSRSQGRNVNEYSWHVYAAFADWFVERDQPEAPRLHNGQMRTTLYATPVGKVKVADLARAAGAA